MEEERPSFEPESGRGEAKISELEIKLEMTENREGYKIPGQNGETSNNYVNVTGILIFSQI